MASGRWRLARAAYATAASYLPGNAEAQEGYGRASARLDEASGIDLIQQLLAIQQQKDRAAKSLKLAVRGLYGEGTQALGDFYQISNQITLGRSETEIIEDFHARVIPKIVDFEKSARAALVKDRLYALDDKVQRAVGTLKNARLMSSDEAMECLSHVRMGVNIGRLKTIDLQTVNELFIQTQPAHLQKLQGERLNGEQRSIARAALVRARLSNN